MLATAVTQQEKTPEAQPTCFQVMLATATVTQHEETLEAQQTCLQVTLATAVTQQEETPEAQPTCLQVMCATATVTQHEETPEAQQTCLQVMRASTVRNPRGTTDLPSSHVCHSCCYSTGGTPEAQQTCLQVMQATAAATQQEETPEAHRPASKSRLPQLLLLNRRKLLSTTEVPPSHACHSTGGNSRGTETCLQVMRATAAAIQQEQTPEAHRPAFKPCCSYSTGANPKGTTDLPPSHACHYYFEA